MICSLQHFNINFNSCVLVVIPDLQLLNDNSSSSYNTHTGKLAVDIEPKVTCALFWDLENF